MRIFLSSFLLVSLVVMCGCEDDIITEHVPTPNAGGPRCNDGYAFALECEPGSQCLEEHSETSDGRCAFFESGDYNPYFEAGGPLCNDGYAFALACMPGHTCVEKNTIDTPGLCSVTGSD